MSATTPEPYSRDQVLAEIESLSADLGVKCRVIENVGAFKFVVSMSCDRAPELGVKLQLTDSYPLEPPCVSVRSAPATEAALAELAAGMRGRAMLSSLAGQAFPASADVDGRRQLEPEPQPQPQPQSQPKKQQHQQRHQQRQLRRAERRRAAAADADAAAQPGGKLRPMKTADDVIKRIQWDAGIPSSDMIIGYVDRFKGVVEKSFDEFSWEDIASVDYYTFVIPRHRICYFKYRRAVVWDKRRRLDLVFGSTTGPAAPADNGDESQQQDAAGDIHQLIANYRDEDYPDGEASMASAGSDSESPDRRHDDDEGSDSDSDSDGVTVRLDRRAVSQAGQAADGDSMSEGEAEAGAGAQASGGGRVYWRDLLRPNFFVCVRVTDPAVAAAAAALQAHVVAQQPAFQPCCIPPGMLHCTLLTLRLDGAEQVAACVAALAAARQELLASLPREPLRLRGTGCFFGRVLHARVQPPPAGLLDFVHHLKAVVLSAGLQVLETHDFVPHVTLLKTSRPVSRQLGSRLIPPRLYAGSEATEYGEQPLDAIYLCSMEKARGPDGFYVAPGCVQFQRTVLEADSR